jgi:hypothetical protein
MDAFGFLLTLLMQGCAVLVENFSVMVENGVNIGGTYTRAIGADKAVMRTGSGRRIVSWVPNMLTRMRKHWQAQVS